VEDMVKTWQGRRVFLTGHTGFKGSWLALWLSRLGAQIRGTLSTLALNPTCSVWHPWVRSLMTFAATFATTTSSKSR